MRIKFDTRKGNIATMTIQIWRVVFHFRIAYTVWKGYYDFELGAQMTQYDWRIKLGFWQLIVSLSQLGKVEGEKK